MSKFKDLTGMTFGRLTVIERAEDKITKSGQRHAMWFCECGCENHTRIVVYGTNLKSGKTKSCGCLSRELAIKRNKKSNIYNLSGEYGIGYTSNTNNEFYFDLEDYDLIKDYCWYLDNSGYIRTNIRDDKTNKATSIQIQRLIMNYPDGLYVDHINHNKRDNRKENLRVVTNQQNSMNHKIRSGNKSGVSGVTFSKQRNKWRAFITVDYKNVNLGYYDNFEDAVTARKTAEDKYFGEFSYDNSVKKE